MKIPLFSRAIEMQQVCLIAGSVVTKPLVNVNARHADLMEHGESVTRRFSFVSDDGRDEVFIHGRLIPPANFKQRGVGIPLDRVPKKMCQQEQALLVGDRIIDVNFCSIKVPGEWVGDVSRNHADSVEGVQMVLSPGTILVEWDIHRDPFYAEMGGQCLVPLEEYHSRHRDECRRSFALRWESRQVKT